MPDQAPGEIYSRAVEPYWLPLNAAWSEDPTELLRLLQSVPEKVRHLYSAHWCVSEVENGGLWQFFFNATGILAPDSIEGLDVIGLKQCAAAVSEAIRFFGTPYPRVRSVRMAKLPHGSGRERKTWDPFQAEDDRFYDCLSQRYIWERAADLYASGA